MPYDSDDDYQPGDVTVGVPGYRHEVLIYLPHSCEQWVIGTADDARRMIRDLEAAIKQMETTDDA